MSVYTHEFDFDYIIRTCTTPNQLTKIHEETVNVNGIDLAVYIQINTYDDICFSVFFKPRTCVIYPEIELSTQMGFINGNGNLCQACSFSRMYKHHENKYWGKHFYKISLNELGKIERYYAHCGKVKIQYNVLKCSVEPCINQVIKSLYISSNAEEAARLQLSHDQLQASNLELIATNDALCTRITDLERSLDEAQVRVATTESQRQMITVVRRSEPEPQYQSTSTSNLQELINQMEIDELNDLSEKIKERIQDLQRCKICLDARSDTLLLPCRHMCMCSACADSYPESNCPVCRALIDDKIRVYQS